MAWYKLKNGIRVGKWKIVQLRIFMEGDTAVFLQNFALILFPFVLHASTQLFVVFFSNEHATTFIPVWPASYLLVT